MSLASIPDAPLPYWLPDRLLELLRSEPRVAEIAVLEEGYKTADNKHRFSQIEHRYNPELIEISTKIIIKVLITVPL